MTHKPTDNATGNQNPAADSAGASLIVLTGPPGAGKSAVGAALAELLGVSFVDTDALVAERAGKSITDIFVDDGEAAFRAMEHEAVASALTGGSGVVSLGGGAVMHEATQQLLRAHTVVFLDVSLRFAARRSGFDQGRPLMALNPRGQWLALMEKRRPTYEGLATVTVDTDNKSVPEVAAEVAEQVAAAVAEGRAPEPDQPTQGSES